MSIIVTLEDWSRARSGKKKSNIGCCSPLLFTVRICKDIMDDVASNANLSRPRIYLKFKSTQDLLSRLWWL